MKRRNSIIVLLALGIAPGSLLAQPGKVWRIGVLETTAPGPNAANFNAFRQRLLELGYLEGRNYVIEYRFADGRNDAFPALVAELIRLKVDLIVTRGTPATQASQAATTTIPVVVTATAAPLQFADSLARPGRNITGLTAMNFELVGKRIQLIREFVPEIVRFGAMFNLGNVASPTLWKETEPAARSMGLQPQLLDVRKAEDLGGAFELAVRLRARAMTIDQDGLFQAHRKLVVELAARHRLPAIYASREFVDEGGLVSYGVAYPDLYRRAAEYADKIFKGARPGDLPMEQPTKFELVVNLKAAKALGITIPASVLLRADEVIR